MANETLRSVSINVAQERIHIRTDLPDTDLKEIVDFIESRLDNSSKFKLELKKQLCLLAVELTSEIIELRKQGLLYPEIVSVLGCSYAYVKEISRENDLGYSKDELAKRSGSFKSYKDWQITVDDYYGGPGIAEVIEQHRSSNGETKVTVRCVKCGDIKDLSSVTLRKNHQGRCFKCQADRTQKKKASERFEREWREEYRCHSNGRQMKIRLCECGAVIPLDKHGGVTLCDDCRTRHKLAQKRKDNKKREIKRRHKLKGGDWSINLEELFERDHGLCYLCQNSPNC